MSAQMIQRRTFLAGLSGLVLVASVSRIAKAADAPKYGADGMQHGWRDDPLTFVAIGEDGIVTVVVHRSEMGQGIRTGLPMVIADELDANVASLSHITRLIDRLGRLRPYNGPTPDGHNKPPGSAA